MSNASRKPRARPQKPKAESYRIPVDVDTIRNPDLSPVAKTVWMVLRTYANKEGIAFPSQDTIARDSCISLRSVGKYLEELTRARLLQIVSQGSNMKKASTVYRVQSVQNLHTSTVHSFLEDNACSVPSFSGVSWERYLLLKGPATNEPATPCEFVEVEF
jgi:hypothetical protein